MVNWSTTGEYESIPEYLIEDLKAYVYNHYKPSHWLTAVLANDLFEVVTRSDREHLAILPVIVKFIYNRLPVFCWGSSAAVSNHLQFNND